MKLLFVCTTELQLLTALNLKYNIYKDDIADIIVDNYHGEEAALADRIKQTNIFRNVCFVKSNIEEKTIHAYLRGISDGKTNITSGDALVNSFFFVWSRIKTVFSKDKGWLSVLVNDFSKLTMSEYDAFFGYGGKKITKHVRSFLNEINPSCKIVQLDEGVGAYCAGNVGENTKIDSCEVYEPDLLQFTAVTKKVPAIDKEDNTFVNIVNQIFEYDDTKNVDFSGNIVFFDQGVSSPMPKYLRNASFLTKLIFHNSYRRHKVEEDVYERWKQITLEILKSVGEKNIWVKMHPRASSEALSFFAAMPNVNIMPQYRVPWEIMALNSKVEDSVLMSFFSSSTCLHNSVVKSAGKNMIILLYDMVDLPIEQVVVDYCKALSKRFNNKIFIPKDKEEFLSFWKK